MCEANLCFFARRFEDQAKLTTDYQSIFKLYDKRFRSSLTFAKQDAYDKDGNKLIMSVIIDEWLWDKKIVIEDN